MKNVTWLKSLIMVLVTILASTLYANGIPSNKTGWEIIGITTLGTLLVYLGHNAKFPSKSEFLSVNGVDILNGILLSIGSFLSSWVANLVVNQAIDWHNMWKLMGTVALGYLIKTFAQKKKTV